MPQGRVSDLAFGLETNSEQDGCHSIHFEPIGNLFLRSFLARALTAAKYFSKNTGAFFIHHAPLRIFSTLKVEFNL